MLLSIIFTTIILTSIHLYSTFASPAASKRDVPADQSLNLTHLLSKRNYSPPDQLCDLDLDWAARRCLDSVSDRRYQDICLAFTNDGSTVYVYVKYGDCDEDAMCFNKEVDSENPSDPTPAQTSECIERPVARDAIITTPDGSVAHTGVVKIGGDVYPNKRIRISAMTTIPQASISAFIDGSTGNYVIAPSADIVGTLVGTSTTACTFNITNHVCVPSGRYDLRPQDAIDFSFAIQANQRGRFYYAILGSEDN